MKRLIFETIIFVLILVSPIPAMASGRMEVGVSIPMPPVIVFAGPPHVVVIPETYVYFVPDIDEDIFFYSGWWWRPWQGRWYRSHDYRSGWSHYGDVPSFYRDVPPGWRNDYSRNRWKGRQWEHQPIHHEQVEKNWDNWEKNKHWEKQNNWGVHDMRPETGPRYQIDRDQQQDARDRQRYGPDQQQDDQDRRQENDRDRQQQYDRDRRQQQDDRDRQRENDRERQQSRDAVEPERSQPQPQHSQPQQRGHDRRKNQKDDRD
ncbi:MAG: hypothetical protein WC836_20175 [Desulfobacula sp.]